MDTSGKTHEIDFSCVPFYTFAKGELGEFIRNLYLNVDRKFEDSKLPPWKVTEHSIVKKNPITSPDPVTRLPSFWDFRSRALQEMGQKMHKFLGKIGVPPDQAALYLD